MRIAYLTPSLNIHGGIRVLIEHCNHLAAKGHDVTLQNFTGNQDPAKYWKIDSRVKVVYETGVRDIYDVVVAGSPPLANILQRSNIRGKKFFLLQMAEHLFMPGNIRFMMECNHSYQVPFPIIGISRWVEYLLKNEKKRNEPMYYIGNGVSEDFKPVVKPDEKIILIEGWESYNQAKDVSGEAHKVAKKLKEDGYTIKAFSQFPIKTNPGIPHQYIQSPSQEELVKLYQEATILLKASRLDARSCAPVEAIACNTVPVRAILHGDDDLLHGYNAMVSGYGDTEQLYRNAKKVLEDDNFRFKLVANCKQYRKEFLSWNKWIDIVEGIYTL